VLPEYAPAVRQVANPVELVQTGPGRRLLALAGSIRVAYAPVTEQARCAQLLRQQAIDFLLVACWPYLIQPILINSASRAALNLHPSLLPLHRGPDPIGEQMASGERPFGVTLHLLNSEFDEGDIVAQSSLTGIAASADRSSIEQQAAKQGCRLFIDAINGYDGGWQLQPQAPAIPTGGVS
jgi:methionyl-tRNA formyltransferase